MKVLTCRAKNGGQSIGSVPSRDSQRLLSTTIPLTSHDTEQWQGGSFEQTKEKSSNKKRRVVVRRSHACLRRSPTKHKHCHQDTMRDLDDQDRGKWQPTKLGDGSHGSHQRVLSPNQMGVFLKSEKGTISQNGFVKNLVMLKEFIFSKGDD